MPAAWGPVEWEFTATEIAVIFAIFGLVPPFVVAVVGWMVHSLVLARRGAEVKLMSLFARWLGWCTLAWVSGWLLAAMFA